MRAPIGDERDKRLLLRAREPDISEPPLLLQPCKAAFIKRALAGKQPLLPARQEHDGKLKPLGGMQSHQGDFLARAVFFGRFHHQRHMLQEAGECLEILHRAHKLFEVLKPARCIGRFVVLPHLGEAGFIQDHLRKIEM